MIYKRKNREQYIKRDEKNKTIVFEKKITSKKSGMKMITWVLGIGVIIVILSNIIMKVQYDKLFYQVSEYDFNEEMVILDYTKIVEKVSSSLVTISDKSDKLTNNTYFEKNITGVIIDNNGTILTNYAVAEEYEKIFVKLPSKGTRPVEANLIIADKGLDLGIIKINVKEELNPIKFAEEDSIREGQEIVILGNSLGDEYIGSVVPGVITTKNSKVIGNDGNKDSLLQISAPVNKYNTGGAICNAKGELIGIATVKITNEKNQSGLYYGMQLEEIKTRINLTDSIYKIMGIKDGAFITYNSYGGKGFYIQELDKNGNLFKAGIKPTDIIVKIENKEFTEIEEMIAYLESKKTGEVLNFQILNNGEFESVDITLMK